MSRRGRDAAPFSLFAFQDIITSVTGIMILITLILAIELIQRADSEQQRSMRTVEEARAAVASVANLREAVAQDEKNLKALRQQINQQASAFVETARYDASHVQTQLDDLKRLNQELEQETSRRAERSREAKDRENAAREQLENRQDDRKKVAAMLAAIKDKKQKLKRLRKLNRMIFNPAPGDPKTPWLLEISADHILAAQVGVETPPAVFENADNLQQWAKEKRNHESEYFVLLIKPDGVEKFQNVNAVLRKLDFDMGYELLSIDQTAIDPRRGAPSE